MAFTVPWMKQGVFVAWGCCTGGVTSHTPLGSRWDGWSRGCSGSAAKGITSEGQAGWARLRCLSCSSSFRWGLVSVLSFWGCFPTVTFPCGSAWEQVGTHVRLQGRPGWDAWGPQVAVRSAQTPLGLIPPLWGKTEQKRMRHEGASLGPCINHGSACATCCKLLLWAGVGGEKVPVPEVFGPVLVFCLPDAGCSTSVLAFRSLPLAFHGP